MEQAWTEVKYLNTARAIQNGRFNWNSTSAAIMSGGLAPAGHT